MDYNFTLSNPSIARFFEGDDSVDLTSEYKYLHEHPLIKPSFVTEVTDLVNKTGEHLKKRNYKTLPPSFTEAVVGVANNLPDGPTAALGLRHLRDLRNVCIELLKV